MNLFIDDATGGGAPLLLDTYTGAVGGYSIARKLTASATLALNVRKAGGTFLDIGFSGDNLDSAAMLTFVAGGDGELQRLYDQVSSESLSPSGSRPTLVTAGAQVLVGGKPAATFGSTPITSQSATWSADVGVNGNLSCTVFIVHRKTTAANGCLFGWGNSGASLAAFGIYDDNSFVQVACAGGQGYNVTAFANNTQYLTTIIKTPGALNATTAVYRNGTAIGTGGSGSTPNVSSSGMTLGAWTNYGSNQFGGQIQELIIFAGDKSSDRAAIESDIRTYYGF